jgi:hypothetical protein
MQYKRNNKLHVITLAVVLFLSATSSAFAFTLNVNFASGSTFTTSQQNIINSAANYWESVITGYQPGTSFGAGIIVEADNPYIDGVGDTLGSAGPTSTYQDASYWFTSTGSMRFDSADINDLENAGTLYDVIVHELAHIIGFGTLWDDNNLYTNGTGQYTGAAALAAYKAEFNSAAAFVPVELGGGSGTANGHWDEQDDGYGPDTQPMGKYELMTGWLNSPGSYISNTTIASFIDLGYTVNLAAVPLPAAVWLFGSGLLGLVGWSKRKQAA